MLRPILVTVTALIFISVATAWQPLCGADVHCPVTMSV